MSGIQRCWLLVSLALFALVSPTAQAKQVLYDLSEVRLADNTLMSGQFVWVFAPGDFLGGVGQFITLQIPHTVHDHTDLDANIDVGESIEITLPVSTHDDGVDIMLVLERPLTPTTFSPIDLSASKYEIGGNGFHDGAFLSGRIVPTAVPEPATTMLWLTGLAVLFVKRRRVPAMRRS